MTIKFPAAMKAAFGENPKRVFSSTKNFLHKNVDCLTAARDPASMRLNMTEALKTQSKRAKNLRKSIIHSKRCCPLCAVSFRSKFMRTVRTI